MVFIDESVSVGYIYNLSPRTALYPKWAGISDKGQGHWRLVLVRRHPAVSRRPSRRVCVTPVNRNRFRCIPKRPPPGAPFLARRDFRQ